VAVGPAGRCAWRRRVRDLAGAAACAFLVGAFRDTSAPARLVRTHMDSSAVTAFFRVLDREMKSDKAAFCAVLAQMLYYDNLYNSSERAREALKLIQSTWRRRRARRESTPPNMYLAWGLVHKHMYDSLEEQKPTKPYTRTRTKIVVLPEGGFQMQSNTHLVQGHRRRHYGWKKQLHDVHAVCKHAVLIDFHWKDSRKRKR